MQREDRKIQDSLAWLKIVWAGNCPYREAHNLPSAIGAEVIRIPSAAIMWSSTGTGGVVQNIESQTVMENRKTRISMILAQDTGLQQERMEDG